MMVTFSEGKGFEYPQFLFSIEAAFYDKLGMILMWSSKYKEQKGFHQFHNRKKLVCLKNFGEVSTFTKVSSLLFFVITSSQKTSQRNFNRLRAIKLAQLNQITKKTFPRLKNRCKTREDENKADSLYSDSIRSNVA